MTLSTTNGSSLAPFFNLPQNLLHLRAQHQSAPTAQESSAANINEKRQSALRLLTDTLTRAYEKIASRGLPVPASAGAQAAFTKNSEPVKAANRAYDGN